MGHERSRQQEHQGGSAEQGDGPTRFEFVEVAAENGVERGQENAKGNRHESFSQAGHSEGRARIVFRMPQARPAHDDSMLVERVWTRRGGGGQTAGPVHLRLKPMA